MSRIRVRRIRVMRVRRRIVEVEVRVVRTRVVRTVGFRGFVLEDGDKGWDEVGGGWVL